MPQTKTVSSTASGLGTESIFLPYEVNLLWVRADDWDGGKEAQVWTSYEDDTDSFEPELTQVGGDTPIGFSKSQSIKVDGPCFVRPFLSNPGTGVTFIFRDIYAPNP